MLLSSLDRTMYCETQWKFVLPYFLLVMTERQSFWQAFFLLILIRSKRKFNWQLQIRDNLCLDYYPSVILCDWLLCVYALYVYFLQLHRGVFQRNSQTSSDIPWLGLRESTNAHQWISIWRSCWKDTLLICLAKWKHKVYFQEFVYLTFPWSFFPLN